MIKLIYISLFLATLSSQNSTRDPASRQLEIYKETHKKRGILRTNRGTPVDNIVNSLTVGPRGPTVRQDDVLAEALQKFGREKISSRVVQTKGAGAHGYFVVTNDITRYCKAKVFEKVGKRTKIAVRFSIMFSESGTPDTVRNRRGFAIKFYTEHGTWDLVGADTPTFFNKDGMTFIQTTHALGNNPVTNIRDADMQWDLFSLRPESIHSVMSVFRDEGTPDGYRHLNGHGVNIFKMVNKNCEIFYVRFHYMTDQGIKNLSAERAANLTVIDQNYATRDLYNAIARGEYPSWTLYIQLMTSEQAERNHRNPFDTSREWPLEHFPYMEVGKIRLDKNPENYFAEVEMIAFNPANFVPGIEASPQDKLLQTRLYIYGDAQRHRLGANFLQLPINCPFEHGVTNYQRNGPAIYKNQGGAPVYYPNSFNGPEVVPSAASCVFHVSGDVARYNVTTSDNIDMAIDLWNSLPDKEKNSLVRNIAASLRRAAYFIQKRQIKIFRRVDETFAHMMKIAIHNTEQSV